MTIKRFFSAMLATVLLCVLPSIAFANPRVVFFGDSITKLWGQKRSSFFSDNNFLCKGISGQTTGDMLKRYTADVLNNQPQVVVILAGTNDIAQNDGVYVTAEQISENIFHMAKLAQEQGIKVVLCSVLPSSLYNWGQKIVPTNFIPQLNTLIEEWAANNNCEYVDYYSLFVQADGAHDPKFSYDGTHHETEGYYIMEQAIMPILEPMLK